uniref:Uncharacterized protein n=1 Tax=Cacopsylla melanoneura TaxID=428564 RepID=A0A8D9B1J5_9HEMI
MMFVTCFEKEPPQSRCPTIEIIPENEENKSIKSPCSDKPNGHATNGDNGYTNIRALPVETRRSYLRTVKTIKSMLCCGCCSHTSVSPSQENILEVRSPGISRHDNCPTSAVHSIRSKFTELRGDSVEEPQAPSQTNQEGKNPGGNIVKKLNRSASDMSFSSKHFEKIYSISNNSLDNNEMYTSKNSLSPTENAHFFTRNILSTQEAHCNADGAEIKSMSSRHSHFSQKSMKHVENISMNSNRSYKVLEAKRNPPDLPLVHKVESLRGDALKSSKQSPTEESIPESLKFINSLQYVVSKSPSENNLQCETNQSPKENQISQSAGKIKSTIGNESYHELMEGKPKTAQTKDEIDQNTRTSPSPKNITEDKMSVKENTWFEDSSTNPNKSDTDSIGSYQSDHSISSNHLSFGRSLSMESNESFRQVIKSTTKAFSEETKSRSRVSLNTVIDITKDTSLSIVDFHKNSEIDVSDENNNEQTTRETKKSSLIEIFGFTENFETNALEFSQPNNGKTNEVTIFRNEPVSIAQFATSNFKQINNKLFRRSFSIDLNDNELQHDDKNEVNTDKKNDSHVETEITTGQGQAEAVKSEFCRTHNKEHFDLNGNDERVACKATLNVVTEHKESEHREEKVSVTQVNTQHQSEMFTTKVNTSARDEKNGSHEDPSPKTIELIELDTEPNTKTLECDDRTLEKIQTNPYSCQIIEFAQSSIPRSSDDKNESTETSVSNPADSREHSSENLNQNPDLREHRSDCSNPDLHLALHSIGDLDSFCDGQDLVDGDALKRRRSQYEETDEEMYSTSSSHDKKW